MTRNSPLADEELVVLLDADGSPRGTAPKAAIHGRETPLHLAFSCYIFDAEERLLVTRRARSKQVFPGVVTNSVCGHPAPSESLPEAATRRASTELGLQIHTPRIVLADYGYRAEMHGVVENELCPVLYATAAGQPDPDPAEVDDVRWIAWDTFANGVLDGGFPVSPWCREQVALLVTLGDRPGLWPEADPALLPLAARPPAG